MVARSAIAAVVLLLTALLLVAAGCGGDDDGGGQAAGVSEGSFVGQVEDTDAYIAIVSDGERLAGYVCDSKTVSTWFAGDVGGASIQLLSRDDQQLGDVELSDDRASGEIEIDGERHAFSAERATGEAGLYRAFNEDTDVGPVEVGWVVLKDGSQRGGTNFVDPLVNDRVTRPAPFIDPTTETNVTVNVGGNAIVLAQQRVTQQFINPIIID